MSASPACVGRSAGGSGRRADPADSSRWSNWNREPTAFRHRRQQRRVRRLRCRASPCPADEAACDRDSSPRNPLPYALADGFRLLPQVKEFILECRLTPATFDLPNRFPFSGSHYETSRFQPRLCPVGCRYSPHAPFCRWKWISEVRDEAGPVRSSGHVPSNRVRSSVGASASRSARIGPASFGTSTRSRVPRPSNSIENSKKGQQAFSRSATRSMIVMSNASLPPRRVRVAQSFAPLRCPAPSSKGMPSTPPFDRIAHRRSGSRRSGPWSWAGFSHPLDPEDRSGATPQVPPCGPTRRSYHRWKAMIVQTASTVPKGQAPDRKP